MRIYVKFYAKIRDEIGIDHMFLDMGNNPSRLIEVIREIDRRMNKKIIEEYYVRRRLLISINDTLIDIDDDILLRDGDKIDIMPLPSGG
ncbi:MAG: MoaD/ThiS family protein [Thermoprotei archaeon]|nr:MoaD/ThiS family protein [Thermoprotei archaeon]